MKIKEKTDIHAAPAQVWPYLVDPVIQAAWNPKIVSIDRIHDGPVHPGETFNMIAKMSSKESTSRVEVVEVNEPRRLVFEHHINDDSGDFTVTETLTLEPSGIGSRVQHTIDLRNTPIPMLLRPLIWLLINFGKPAEAPPLNQLKKIIEADLA